ncbi:MAG TPA: ATP-binding protein, partial [Myxococcales bacterium]
APVLIIAAVHAPDAALPTHERRTMTIRTHLLLLVAAAVVPVFAFAVLVSVALVRHERDKQRTGAMDQARAMITAVDAELRGSIATLRALSASRALASGDLSGFHASAARALHTQPGWLDISLSEPGGRQVVDVATDPGTVPAAAADAADVARVASTLEPQVGNVVVDKLLGQPGVPVRVPVIREGKAVWVLTALVRPDAFRDLILQQHLAAGWVSGIVDRDLKFVARVPEVPLGSSASSAFMAAARRSSEGWYRGLTVEGTDTFTAHITSPFSGWTIGLAVPTSDVEAAARHSAWIMSVGAVLSLGLAVLAALFVGRRVADPVGSLAAAARSLGEGKEIPVETPYDVREISAVATALQEASTAIRDRQALLRREKAALEAADVAKDEFLAMLSHELRNPLAALRTAAHILKVMDPAQPAASRARDVIERQTGLMTRLIEDLLDTSRITMGKVALDRRPLDLAEAVGRVMETFRAAGRFSRHRVELHASPAWIEGDRERIDQIVSNLLDNAVKFTPQGGAISVSVGRAGGASRLQVSDDGEGIAADLLPHLFELFVQGPRGIDRSQGGMGIGLALVRRLAEMHGGTAAASSGGPGKGATFTVELPAIAPAVAGETAQAPRPRPGARRILLIEDNDDARTMLRDALALSGHEVADAADGTTGLAIASSHPPEIAVIDIGLPDIDGYEVARRLRRSVAGEIALIALTGYGQHEDRRRSHDAGFGMHLTKPVDLEQLEAAIAALSPRLRT